MRPIVIIGTGLAGYTLAKELRKLDTKTPLILISADDGTAYSKPMLSNGLAQNKNANELAQANAVSMASQLQARILTQTRVRTIDTAAHHIDTGGETITYSKLILAVGATPIRLPLKGNAADEVLQVNSLEDYARFRKRLQGSQSVSVIGAGLIGCEFANDLIDAGYRVTVMGLGETPLDTLIPPLAGTALMAGLESAGVQWRLQSSAQAVERQGDGYWVTLDRGEPVQADLVLSAIGLRPNTQIAAAAGIHTHRGIVTDTTLQTSVEDVYALGDCAEVEGVVRLFVMPIMHGARALARTLTGDTTAVNYPPMPVVIKTPAHPVVICSNDDTGSRSDWNCDSEPGGTRCLQYHNDRLTGFCLTGNFSTERQKWLKEMTQTGTAAP